MLFLSVDGCFVKNPVNPRQAYGRLAFEGRRVDLPAMTNKKKGDSKNRPGVIV
jgi:hypothetical protein